MPKKPPASGKGDAFSKIAIALVIAVIFNTFTSAFLLINMQGSSDRAPEPTVLKTGITFSRPAAQKSAPAKVSAPKAVAPATPLANASLKVPQMVAPAASADGFAGLSMVANPAVSMQDVEADLLTLEDLRLQWAEAPNRKLRRQIIAAINALIKDINSTISDINEVIRTCNAGGECPEDDVLTFLKDLRKGLKKLRTELKLAKSNIKKAFAALDEALEEMQAARVELQDELTMALRDKLDQMGLAFEDNAAYSSSDPYSADTTYSLLEETKEALEALIEEYPELENLDDLVEAMRPLLEFFGIDVDSLVEVMDPVGFVETIQARITDEYQIEMQGIADALEAAGQLPQTGMEDGAAWVQSYIEALQASLAALVTIDVPAQKMQDIIPDMTALTGGMAALDALIDALKGAGSSTLDVQVTALAEDILAHTASTTAILGLYSSLEECADTFENPEACADDDPLCLKAFGECVATEFLDLSLEEIRAAMEACEPTEGLEECMQADPRACAQEILSCLAEELRG